MDFVDFSVIKQEPYISVNPNGRVPAIEDPNTGLTSLWEVSRNAAASSTVKRKLVLSLLDVAHQSSLEHTADGPVQSGAIIEYLLATYDKDNTLSYTSFPEKWLQSSWKHFQMSGQGPYFGQKTWFTFVSPPYRVSRTISLTTLSQFHPEKNLTSVIDRYANEIRRVIGVIEYHLNKTGKEYLVGDKVCFADLMFLPWNNTALGGIMGEDFNKEWQEKYPKAWAWHQRLSEREAVKKTFEKKAEAMKSGH